MDLCEFETSLVYIETSRKAQALLKDSVSKTKINNKRIKGNKLSCPQS